MALPQRPLGHTGQRSSILAFGGAALAPLDPAAAERAVDEALARGVNHFDVAPSYGDAEILLAASVARHRPRMFLACKTRERRRRRARDELSRSLERLRTDHLDLYQCHAVSSSVDLEQILGRGGAIELFEEARGEGLVRWFGITGHHCGVLKDAIERYPFDTVMFPLNPIQASDPRPATDYRPLLETARERSVGAIAIKSVAEGPWPNGERRSYTTWYRPLVEPQRVRERVRFALTHDITTTVLPSDVRLWPAIFEAAERFEPLADAECDALVVSARGSAPLYVEQMVPARQAYCVPRAG
jgi:aryl-alcohol dehydrogenase-like predicted oxidoreductase